MSIWKKDASLDLMKAWAKGTIDTHLGIELIEIGDNFVKGTMPVDKRTRQPMGILHGGASIVLAESLGSLAANMAVDDNHYCVGLEVNANHLRSVSKGCVTGIARALHLGRSTHVWEIKLYDEAEKNTCVSRLTMAVKEKT